MRVRALVVLLVLVGLGVVQMGKPIPAYACSCMSTTAGKAMELSDVVFRGRVVSITGPETASIRVGGVPFEGVSVLFEVDTVWKGASKAQYEVHTGLDSAGCGVLFREGETRIVFATAEDDGALFTSLCLYGRGKGEPSDVVALGAGDIVVTPASFTSVTAEPAGYVDEPAVFSLADALKTVVLVVLAVGLVLMYRDRRRADSV